MDSGILVGYRKWMLDNDELVEEKSRRVDKKWVVGYSKLNLMLPET